MASTIGARVSVFQETTLTSISDKPTLREKSRPSFFSSLVGVLGHYVRISPESRHVIDDVSRLSPDQSGYSLGRAVIRASACSAPQPLVIPTTPGNGFLSLYNEFKSYLPSSLRGLCPQPLSPERGQGFTIGDSSRVISALGQGALGATVVSGDFTSTDLSTNAYGKQLMAILFEYDKPADSTSSQSQPVYRAMVTDGLGHWVPVPNMMVKHTQGGTSSGVGLSVSAETLARQHSFQLKLGRPVLAFWANKADMDAFAEGIQRQEETEYQPLYQTLPTASQTVNESPLTTTVIVPPPPPPATIIERPQKVNQIFPSWFAVIPPWVWGALCIVGWIMTIFSFVSSCIWLGWITGRWSRNRVLDTLIVRETTVLKDIKVEVEDISQSAVQLLRINDLEVLGTAKFASSLTAVSASLQSAAVTGALTATTGTIDNLNAPTLTTNQASAAGVTITNSLSAPGASAEFSGVVTSTLKATTGEIDNLRANSTTIAQPIQASSIDFSSGLTIPSGATLTVDGTLTVNGNTQLNGAASMSGDVTLGPKTTIPSGGSITGGTNSQITVPTLSGDSVSASSGKFGDVAAQSINVNELSMGSMGPQTTPVTRAAVMSTREASVLSLDPTKASMQFEGSKLVISGPTEIRPLGSTAPLLSVTDKVQATTLNVSTLNASTANFTRIEASGLTFQANQSLVVTVPTTLTNFNFSLDGQNVTLGGLTVTGNTTLSGPVTAGSVTTGSLSVTGASQLHDLDVLSPSSVSVLKCQTGTLSFPGGFSSSGLASFDQIRATGTTTLAVTNATSVTADTIESKGTITAQTVAAKRLNIGE